MTHKEVFYLGKAHMYICLSAYKSGVKGCFWWVGFGFFGLNCAKTMGDIFLWGKVVYVLFSYFCGNDVNW
jgi:hypothetical protein